MSFKEFLEHAENLQLLSEQLGQSVGQGTPARKPWSAKKKDIMDMWRRLRDDTPIVIQPMDKSDGDTRSYGEDGIRITGSWQFISSVMSRLKDIMVYENPKTRLRLILRGISNAQDVRPDRNSYVFYVNVEQRGSGKRQPNIQKGFNNDQTNAYEG